MKDGQDNSAAVATEYKLVPARPTKAMLRPFIQCPEDELELAYEAMLIVGAAPTLPNAKSQHGRDIEWVQAIAEALGSNSGYRTPIAPDPAAFRELFAAVRATPPNEDELVKALERLCGLAALRPGHLSDYTAAVNDARQALANYRARKGEQG